MPYNQVGHKMRAITSCLSRLVALWLCTILHYYYHQDIRIIYKATGGQQQAVIVIKLRSVLASAGFAGS
jgi:hypothetical protein